ncbi:MAG: LamG-like jellyroll fold domain-containing protein [bacterium]
MKRTVAIVLVALVAVFLGARAPAAASLRFYGNGVDDIDRVKIRVDDPENSLPGPPADVGAADFTIEFWMRALAAENTAPAVACGANINWILGNIVIDRDRYNQDRKFGLSIAGGVLVFGVSGNGTGDRTLCGTTDVFNGVWRHVAIQRRRSDGQMWLFVDGALQGSVNGPDGDISYPDNGVPGDYCGGPCVNSDPFLVLAAEKHDAGAQYPSYSGWLDEMRISNSIRYTANFTAPVAPFVADANTVALYHFDEGSGAVLGDASGAAGGPSDGDVRFGGSPAGPVWSSESPFGTPTAVPPGGAPASRAVTLVATPNPFGASTVIAARLTEAGTRAPRLTILDASGRRVAELLPTAVSGGVEFVWNRGTEARGAAPGVYFARLDTGAARLTRKLVAR